MVGQGNRRRALCLTDTPQGYIVTVNKGDNMGKAVRRCSCAEDAEHGSSSVHPDHSAQLHRLNRIMGQLEGILTQTSAVKAALVSLEGAILEKHLNSCVVEALLSKDKRAAGKKIAELVKIFSRISR